MKWIVAGLLLVASSCFAGEGMPCERQEYARLKDASKAELSRQYCTARAWVDMNNERVEIRQASINRLAATGVATASRAAQVVEIVEAANTCRMASVDYADMLRKRFGAKRPTCS